MRILDRLEEASVVSFDVCRWDHSKFEAMEMCDYHYRIKLTKAELLQLADELIELANK